MWCNFYSGFSTVVAIYIVTNKYPTDQLQVFQIPVYYYVVYTHNSILIRIMMLMPDCSNCSQVILAKYTMLLSLTHFSDLFWIIVILLTLKKPIYDICGLYYFYTRINFLLQFLFIILFEWFYFIMCPNHFFLKKNDSSLKKKKRKKLI